MYSSRVETEKTLGGLVVGGSHTSFDDGPELGLRVKLGPVIGTKEVTTVLDPPVLVSFPLGLESLYTRTVGRSYVK